MRKYFSQPTQQQQINLRPSSRLLKWMNLDPATLRAPCKSEAGEAGGTLRGSVQESVSREEGLGVKEAFAVATETPCPTSKIMVVNLQ